MFITLQLQHNTFLLAHLLDSINPNSINSDLEQRAEGQENKVEEQTGRGAERQQYLEARHNVMMLMRIKQLVTCSP